MAKIALGSLKGDSAYAVAVAEGFVGSEAAWLLSLKGPSGDVTPAATAAKNAAEAAAAAADSDRVAAQTAKTAAEAAAASVPSEAELSATIAAQVADAVGDAVATPIASAREVFAALDLRAPTSIVVAGAGDSTTDATGEYLETGFKETLAALYPERPAGVIRYNKTNEALMAYEEWQSAATTSPGQTDAVLVSDSFTRTASALSGSMPTVGATAWAGTATQASVNGTRAVYGTSAGVGNALKLPTRVGAKAAVTATIRIAFDLGANTQTRLMLARSGTSTSADRIDINVSGTTSTTTVLRQNLGNVTTTLATFPAGTIPTSAPAADYAFSLAVNAAGDVTATVNGQTVTATLSTTMRDALIGDLWAGFNSTNTAFQMDDLVVTGDTASTPVPSPLSPFVVYNGGYGGGMAIHQIERLDAMYPVRPDLFLICHGHNYHTTNKTPALFVAAIDALVTALHAKYPGVQVGFVSQNPEIVAVGRTATQVAEHAARQLAIREHCAEKGWVYIPAMEAFAALADGGASKVHADDGVHIDSATSDLGNLTGGRIMADALKKWAKAQSLRPTA